MCSNCAELLQFDEAMDLVMPKLDTLNQLSDPQSAMIDTSKDKIRERAFRRTAKPGERIGALLEACVATSKAHFLGYGVYEGDFIPPPEVNPDLNPGIPNPKLILDNGQVVWGCECWWMPEEDMKDMLKGFQTIVTVDIEKARKANEQDTKTTGSDENTEDDPASLNRDRGHSRWKWSKE
jgi:hypothetical protein